MTNVRLTLTDKNKCMMPMKDTKFKKSNIKWKLRKKNWSRNLF